MDQPYAQLLSPLQVGPLALPNRVKATPHASGIGSIWGNESQAEVNLAYWEARLRGGIGWLGGISAAVENLLPPGFEPTGVGAVAHGVFRMPVFHERMSRISDLAHRHGVVATAQMIIQGGMPHGPSATTTAYPVNAVSHALTKGEIEWFIAEYAFSAAKAQAAGLDGVELHANHDDLIEWFLSPLCNRRDDEYGGDLAGRMKFLVDLVDAVRGSCGPGFALGVRMNLWQALEGGYDAAGAIDIAKALEATGKVDYLSVVVGDNWGAPSYIQSHHYAEAQWAPMAGALRSQVGIPVVYTGRVTQPAAAEELLVAGHADVVGLARALITDPDWVAKAGRDQAGRIRPCIGCNECIHRRLVDKVAFACAANPVAGNEARPVAPTSSSRRVLVVGGGPGGMEVAGLLAETGHDVTLWERSQQLGGQLQVAAVAPENAAYRDYVDWQEGRLAAAGVAVELKIEATLDSVRAFGADEVIVATGASPRVPGIAGIDQPFVVEGRDVLAGTAVELGEHVAVLALEDHMQPLSIAGHLVDLGHQVTVVYPSPGPAPLVGKYTLGAALGKLANADATLVLQTRVTAIERGRLRTANIYTERPGEIAGVDSVVIAAGGTPDDGLYRELVAADVPGVRVLGDAFAPRRISFATRQALEVARSLAEAAGARQLVVKPS